MSDEDDDGNADLLTPQAQGGGWTAEEDLLRRTRSVEELWEIVRTLDDKIGVLLEEIQVSQEQVTILLQERLNVLCELQRATEVRLQKRRAGQ
jgi:hypothetical protein